MDELQERENEVVLVYATFPGLAEAEEISCKLLGENLIACANIFSGMISIYRWNNMLERDTEVVVIFKTDERLSQALVSRIEQLHSYDVPAILVLPVSGGNQGYIDWVTRMTGGDGTISGEVKG